MLILYASDIVISYACVSEESYFKNWAMVVFISYLIILKLILIFVVLNYPKLYLGRALGRALDYGPFAYGRCKAIFFFPLKKREKKLTKLPVNDTFWV